MIPFASRRDEILKAYFESLETKQRFETLKPYPSFSAKYIFDIDDSVLVNSVNNIQFLTKAKKYVRKRGKIQVIEGTNIKKVATGDSIRGQLHQETFYGAMKPAKLDENGKMQKDENGNFIQEDKVKYTIRVPFQYKTKPDASGFKTWEDIEKQMVDKGLKKQIKHQIEKAGGLREAFEAGIFMYDKEGKKVNKIRHIRVWASVSEPLQVKKQTYLSSKEYKQHYYAANATNSYFALYEDKEKTKKDFDFRNLMEVAQSLAIDDIEDEKDLFAPFITIQKGKVEKQLDLKYILKPGIRVVFLKEKELKNEIGDKELFNRFYVYTNFEKNGNSARLNFKHHIEARSKTDIKDEYIESEFDWEKPKPTLRFGYGKYDFLVEGYDFEVMIDGSIKLK
ncbi:MAG: hypothetical protein QM743_03470 [Chitinophagaceae bacterium]